MAVHYDEKPDKDGQTCDIRDIVARRNVLCLTVPLNQQVGGPIDCTIHVSKIYMSNVSLTSVYSLYSETLKHISKTYLRSDMQITAVTI